MYDINKQCFVVLTFATVSELHDLANDIDVMLQCAAIVEIAAVKIEKGVICGHYHSFVGIDGYNARDIQFDCGNYGAYGIRAEHLIGAPALKEVISRLYSYIGGSTLLVQSTSINTRNPFTVFKDSAKSYGYCFNNPTIELKNISAAARLQSAVQSSGADLREASILHTANMLADKSETWIDIFAEYGIYFDPQNADMSLRDRNDSLSWALMFAKLFVAIVQNEEQEELAIEQVDEMNECGDDEKDIPDNLDAAIKTTSDVIDSDSEE